MHICSMFYGINDFTAYNIAYRAARRKTEVLSKMPDCWYSCLYRQSNRS